METNPEMHKQKEQKCRYLYIYGVVQNKEIELDINGLKDKPIQKVDLGDFTILLSAYPSLRPVLKEEEAMLHAGILEKIMEKTNVIPMAFGNVFKNKKILKAVLQSSYSVLKETFGLIDNKIELGVKVIKNQTDEVHEGAQEEILESLKKLSVKSVKGDAFSDRLVLNHSFLVERNDFARFSEEIEKLEDKYKNLKFVYTGPWPPYSFVDIKITGRQTC